MYSQAIKTIAFSFLILLSIASHTQSPHIHGEAQLHVVMDDKKIHVSLKAPAESMVGFEHAPVSSAEKAAIQKASMVLSSPHMFTFYRKTIFNKTKSLDLDLASIHASLSDDTHNNHTHVEKTPHTHQHTPTQNEHTDFIMTAVYKSNKEIHGISTQLFEHFVHLRTIILTLVDEDQSSQYRLTRHVNKVIFK